MNFSYWKNENFFYFYLLLFSYLRFSGTTRRILGFYCFCWKYVFVIVAVLMSFLNFFSFFFLCFPIKERSCCYKMRCQRKNKHFEVRFWRIRSLPFPSKDRNTASHEWRNGLKGVFFPPESAFQPLILFF